MTPKILQTISLPMLAILALIASLAALAAVLSATATAETPAVEINVGADEELLTKLTIEGVASRSVQFDGAVGRFTVSALRDSIVTAVSDGNDAVTKISEAVVENCTPGEENADHTSAPTCISPNGLQTVGISIREEFDWTERGRVSKGFRYENSLSIAIRGTGFAGGLVDLVVRAGGDLVRFDGISFTASGRAEAERLALLDAIDDARATADSIADHMSYEIVRIVELNPVGQLTASNVAHEEAEEAMAMADDSFTPTPVFGGSETVSSRVRIVFELRPLSVEE